MIKNEYYDILPFEQKVFLVRLKEEFEEECQRQFDYEKHIELSKIEFETNYSSKWIG